MGTAPLPANERIRQRRESLGKTVSEMAGRLALSTAAYEDIELHPDEIHSVVPLAEVRELAAILEMSALDMLGMRCDFCEGAVQPAAFHGRSALISERRSALGLSAEQVADPAGYPAESIEMIERGDESHLDAWTVEEVVELARTLDVPPQALLGLRCRTCGR